MPIPYFIPMMFSFCSPKSASNGQTLIVMSIFLITRLREYPFVLPLIIKFAPSTMNLVWHIPMIGNMNWMTERMANPTLPNAAAIRSWYELVSAMAAPFSIRIME